LIYQRNFISIKVTNPYIDNTWNPQNQPVTKKKSFKLHIWSKYLLKLFFVKYFNWLLEVTMQITRPLEFNEWNRDIQNQAISFLWTTSGFVEMRELKLNLELNLFTFKKSICTVVIICLQWNLVYLICT